MFNAYFKTNGTIGNEEWNKRLPEFIQLGEAVTKPETDNPTKTANITLHYLSEEIRKKVKAPSATITGITKATHEERKDLLAIRKFKERMDNNQLDTCEKCTCFNTFRTKNVQ